MKRIAFKMFLNEGCEAEYKKRHSEIWPELKEVLKKSGIAHYSIYLDSETQVLFGVLQCSDNTKYQDLPLHPVMQKWWDYMKDIMKTHEDHSPVSVPLTEVFYLE